jgi:hypothetical protein
MRFSNPSILPAPTKEPAAGLNPGRITHRLVSDGSSARTDLRGGRWVTAVPTATPGNQRGMDPAMVRIEVKREELEEGMERARKARGEPDLEETEVGGSLLQDFVEADAKGILGEVRGTNLQRLATS